MKDASGGFEGMRNISSSLKLQVHRNGVLWPALKDLVPQIR